MTKEELKRELMVNLDFPEWPKTGFELIGDYMSLLCLQLVMLPQTADGTLSF